MQTPGLNAGEDGGHVEDSKGSRSHQEGLCSTVHDLSGLMLDTDALTETLTATLPWLSELTELNIGCNSLTALPSHFLVHLGNVTSLDVRRNRLQIIPKEIGALVQLRDLCALSNHLRPPSRSLPLEELASLASLERIDLRYNKKLMGARGDACAALLRQRLPQVSTVLVTGVADQQSQALQADANSRSKEPHDDPASRDACTLCAQLEPLSTPQLRRRLARDFADPTEPDVVDRRGVMERLLRCYQQEGCTPRRIISYSGRPLCATIANELEQELRGLSWHEIQRERHSVRASAYFTIKKSRAARGPHAKLWQIASEALASVVCDEDERKFAAGVTALAISRNFQGSPHIDTHDRDVQFAFSCGSFGEHSASDTSISSLHSAAAAGGGVQEGEGEVQERAGSGGLSGGKLCVELNALDVAEVDTYLKIAKVDGRFPHWVSPYGAGDRFSVIWYRTEGAVRPPTLAVYPP